MTESFSDVMKNAGGRPDNLERTFEELVEMSTNPDGSIDLATFDNAPVVGHNGPYKCDVTSGPCSCGAWH